MNEPEVIVTTHITESGVEYAYLIPKSPSLGIHKDIVKRFKLKTVAPQHTAATMKLSVENESRRWRDRELQKLKDRKG